MKYRFLKSIFLSLCFCTYTHALTFFGGGSGTFSGTLGMSNGGTGSVSFTAGSVVFSNGSVLTEDNSNLFWNNTSKRLGIGITTPTQVIDVVGSVNASVGFTGILGSDTIIKDARFTTSVNAQTTINYTLTYADCGKLLTFNNASATTLNLPQQSSVSTSVGYFVNVRNLGAGKVTVIKQGAETLDGNTVISQYATMKIERPTSTKWGTSGGTAVMNMLGIPIFIQTVGNNTYYFSWYSGCSGTILGVSQIARSITTPGSFNIKINGTDVTGLTSIVPTTTGNYTTATAANTFVRGDKLTIVYTGTSSVLYHSVVLDYTQEF
jgi:hypothetical protein